MATARVLNTLPWELAVHASSLAQCSRPWASQRRAGGAVFRHWQRRASSTSAKQYYATTPIFYVNAAPHIGHLHSILLADVYTRYAALRQDDSERSPVLCTGTDEHGLKIQRVAEAQGVTPKALCDSVSERFRDLARDSGINHKVFIRTTEERHRLAVEHIWRELKKRDHIYKSSYAGWYAVSDEAYYSDAQVTLFVDPVTGSKNMVSLESGSKVEWMEEDTYKFRLSAFREPLLKWLSESSVIQPPSRSKALLAPLMSETSSDLADLSISRPRARLSWGIAVPDDPEHTIYVWVDALVNYLTAAGYPWQGGEAFSERQLWPPNLQVVGKDIVRFHALYLPAILMALDLPLPTRLLVHGHWTMDKFKMSKSRGNVADPFEAMRLWGTDAMRAYLMRVGGNSAVDADYSPAEIERFYKKDLAGSLGNLVSRISNRKLLARLPDHLEVYTAPASVLPEDEAIHSTLESLPDAHARAMADFEVHRAIGAVFDALYEANRYLQMRSPWLPATSLDEVHRALYYVSEALRLAGILLGPTMPRKSAELLDVLGVDHDKRAWRDARLGAGGERTIAVGSKQLFPAVVLPNASAGGG